MADDPQGFRVRQEALEEQLDEARVDLEAGEVTVNMLSHGGANVIARIRGIDTVHTAVIDAEAMGLGEFTEVAIDGDDIVFKVR